MAKLNLIRLLWFGAIIVISILYYLTIPILRRIKMGQIIRVDGPTRHLSKAGTPTMGGLIFIIGSLGVYLIFLQVLNLSIYTFESGLILISFLGYGFIGFFDDYLIVIKKNNRGISVKIKFFIQFLIALIIYLLYLKQGLSSTINLFGWHINIGFLFGIFILFFYVGVTNAVNITDGIDGLAGGLSLIAYGAYGVLAYHNNMMEAFYFTLALMSGLIAFFIFNFHPAKIFMGNTGSMALGGGLAGIALLLKMEVLLVIVGGVFVWETLSDIIQIWYFKKTKGKRIFLMAPFHHHLELKGWSEWKIDLIFWLIGFILALIGIYLGVKLF